MVETPDRMRLRIAGAACAYAMFLFSVYAATGPLRVFQLDPALGAIAGATVEAGLFMPVIVFGGTLIPAVFRLTASSPALLKTGVLALVVFLVADTGAAAAFCGVPALQHLSRFFQAAGWIQGGVLLLFAIFPWMWWHADHVRNGRYPALPARGLSRSGP